MPPYVRYWAWHTLEKDRIISILWIKTLSLRGLKKETQKPWLHI